MGIRSRFSELVDHLKTQAKGMGVAPENFQAEVAHMTLAAGGHRETEQGWHLSDFRYRGVLFVERLRRADAIRLLMYCRAWLDGHDDTRVRYKLEDPTVNLVQLDAGDLVDVLLFIDFVDPVYLAEAADGDVEWNGRRYAAVDYDLWIAERGAVNGASTE